MWMVCGSIREVDAAPLEGEPDNGQHCPPMVWVTRGLGDLLAGCLLGTTLGTHTCEGREGKQGLAERNVAATQWDTGPLQIP